MDAADSSDSFENTSRRLRTVHACDQCRARKVKCLNVPGQTRCLACERHRVDCTFAWREAYLVRSERAAANVMGAPGSVATTSSSLGSMSLVNFTPTTSEEPTLPEPVQATPGPPPGPDLRQPPANLMPHFIELFFKHYGAAFPFLSYEAVVTNFLHCQLSPLLSNAMASLAARHSRSMPELAFVDPVVAPEFYASQAKNMLRVFVNTPAIDTLAAVVLMAYVEREANRNEGFDYFAQVAAQMTQALDFSAGNVDVARSTGLVQPQQLAVLRAIAAGLNQLRRRSGQ